MQTMADDPAAPSVESFSLSSAFLRDVVSSWVPPSFGVSKPRSERDKEFVAAMARGGRRGAEWEVERLGLGHPLLEPGTTATAGPSSGSRDFSALAKHLARPGADSGSSASIKRARTEEEDDDEEETSRFKSVGKGKGKMEAAGVQSLLNGKKKKKKTKREDGTVLSSVAHTQPTVEARAEALSIAPLAILKPVAAPSTPKSSSPAPEAEEEASLGSAKTKAERRREAKKRRRQDKKLAHAL